MGVGHAPAPEQDAGGEGTVYSATCGRLHSSHVSSSVHVGTLVALKLSRMLCARSQLTHASPKRQGATCRAPLEAQASPHELSSVGPSKCHFSVRRKSVE